MLFPQHPSRPTSCTWPSSSYVRSSTRRPLASTIELFRMSIARVPPPVASNSSEALVAFNVPFEACEERVHDIFGVNGRQYFHNLSFFLMFTKKGTQARAGGFIALSQASKYVSPCTCCSCHQPSRLACPCVTSGDASSLRAACGHLYLAASCDQAIVCLALVIRVSRDHARHAGTARHARPRPEVVSSTSETVVRCVCPLASHTLRSFRQCHARLWTKSQLHRSEAWCPHCGLDVCFE